MSVREIVRRARPWLLCLLIVAVFRPPAAGAVAVSEDAPVPGGLAAFARNLGVDPVPDRGRFVYEVTRLVYDSVEIRSPSVAAFLQLLRQPSRRGARIPIDERRPADDVVPVPLTSQTWGDAVFHRRVAADELLSVIVADRQASLLCHGLASLDDPTLEYLAGHPQLLARLYERSAPSFAAFADGLHIAAGRIVTPGDPGALLLWESVVNEPTARPDRFIAQLFELGDGRMAYLYDTIAHLDPPRRAFALGAGMTNQTARLERFRALAAAVLGSMREWHLRVLPFGRQSYDLAMALARIDVGADGLAAAPSSARLWSRVMADAWDPGLPGASGGDGVATDRIDAAWLAGVLGKADARQRGERLDQIGFAQRVLRVDPDDESEAAFVLRSFPRVRALMLTLERMGVHDIDLYGAAVRRASKISGLEGRRGFIAQAQLQGALALLAGLTRAGTLDPASNNRLLRKLFSVDLTEEGRYAGAIAGWLQFDLRAALPPARDAEHALVSGLGGPTVDPAGLRRITWEGQHYRLDFAGAERGRLQRIREKQGGVPLDVPLQLADASRMLRSGQVSVDDLQDLALQLSALASDLPPRSSAEEMDAIHGALRRAIDELTRATRNKETKRLSRLSELLADLGDEMLAQTLLSFAYALDLGDPDGTALLAGDVSHRHDFGLGIKDSEARARVAWSIPRQEVAPGVPWHVRGSLLGLDVALSSLALRRVSADQILEAPRLTSNAREAFAISVSLLDPLLLRDQDGDAIARAVDRGRARAAGATTAADVDALADQLSMEGARRRAMQWTRLHEPERLPSMLSLTELLTLGGGRTADLHAWGMAAVTTAGCLCSRLMPAGRWPTLSGRPALGLSASVLPDLNFQVAMVLRDVGLPASLAKVVLSAAMQDFIDEVKPTDEEDWLTLSRAARAMTRERIEDYLAAATAAGPLVPDELRTPRQ